MTRKHITVLCLFCLLISSSYAQLVNPDFETWETNPNNASPYAPGWLQPNDYCYQVQPAQNGNYALRVSVWYYYTKTRAMQKAPLANKPQALTGYYTYTDNEVRALDQELPVKDTAMVSVFLTRWNSSSQQSDTVGSGQLLLLENATYTLFSCPLTYTGTAQPDSITIIFDPSVVRRHENVTWYQAITPNGHCSFFTIDNLLLHNTATGIAEETGPEPVGLFPNPATASIQVITALGSNYAIQITDLAGKVLKYDKTTGQTMQLTLTDLAPGVYLVMFTDMRNQSTTVKKLVKQE